LSSATFIPLRSTPTSDATGRACGGGDEEAEERAAPVHSGDGKGKRRRD